jgi:predicted HAD superfamily phosphohydrolase
MVDPNRDCEHESLGATLNQPLEELNEIQKRFANVLGDTLAEIWAIANANVRGDAAVSLAGNDHLQKAQDTDTV